jgi:hypothetical protein
MYKIKHKQQTRLAGVVAHQYDDAEYCYSTVPYLDRYIYYVIANPCPDAHILYSALVSTPSESLPRPSGAETEIIAVRSHHYYYPVHRGASHQPACGRHVRPTPVSRTAGASVRKCAASTPVVIVSRRLSEEVDRQQQARQLLTSGTSAVCLLLDRLSSKARQLRGSRIEARGHRKLTSKSSSAKSPYLDQFRV